MLFFSVFNIWMCYSYQQHVFYRPLNALIEVNQALLAAIESLGNKDKKEKVSSRYKVEGPQSELI